MPTWRSLFNVQRQPAFTQLTTVAYVIYARNNLNFCKGQNFLFSQQPSASFAFAEQLLAFSLAQGIWWTGEEKEFN
jgi:hypothetical protein